MSTAVDIPAVPAKVEDHPLYGYSARVVAARKEQHSQEMERLKWEAEPTVPLNPEAVALAEQQRTMSTDAIEQVDFPESLASDVEAVMAMPDEDEDFHKRPTEYVESVKIPCIEQEDREFFPVVSKPLENVVQTDEEGRAYLQVSNPYESIPALVEAAVSAFYDQQQAYPVSIRVSCFDCFTMLPDSNFYTRDGKSIPYEAVPEPPYRLMLVGKKPFVL